MRIPAFSVSRAQTFYEAVFDWKFRPSDTTQSYAADQLRIFHTPGSAMGGIAKVYSEEQEGKKKDGGIVVYMVVEDVKATLEKAKAAGGQVLKEMWIEGHHTELGEFKDSEGNLVGVLRWLI